MADTRSETRKRFDAAFAAALKRKDKTFDFDGRPIAVKLKEDSAETPKKPSMAAQGLTAKGEPAPLKNIPKLSDEEQSMPAKKPSMAAQGLTAKGEQAPLRNIPVLPNKVEKEDKVSTQESLSSGEEAMKRGGKVKSSASKRADGIATKGFTKGRYM